MINFKKHIEFKKYFLAISELAEKLDVEVYIVGGYIRDLILGNDTDEVEQHFAFELIDSEVKDHIKKLEEFGVFNSWYDDPQLKKKAKEFWRSEFQKPLFSVMNISAEAFILGNKYHLTAKIGGPLKQYSEAIIKKKMKKFTNESKLIYVKLEELGDVPKTLYEIGHEKLGNQLDEISTAKRT